MKNSSAKIHNKKKSCAKVLNYFASPSITKKASCLHKKKRTKIKKKMANASY
jgi:hypothetical protein